MPLLVAGASSSAIAALTITGTLSTGAADGAERRGSHELDLKSVQLYLEENPGVPLVLPASPPKTYRWLGPAFLEVARNGSVEARSSLFTRDRIAGGPTVELCVQVPAVDRCSHGDFHITRVLESGEIAVVAFRGPHPDEAEISWWSRAQLDTSGTPAWLD